MSTATTSPPRERAGSDRTRALATSNGARLLWLVAFAALLGFVVVCSVAVGTRNIPLGTALRALLGDDGSQEAAIIRALRLPRTMAGLLVGVATGLAGALIQAMTRNPLADPGILGVNSGAALALVIAVAILGVRSPFAYMWFSFAGAIVATVVVYALGSMGRGAATPVRLALAGVAISSVIGGIASIILTANPSDIREIDRWTIASIANPRGGVFLQVAPFVAAGVVLAFAVARPLNSVALGDDLARALGTDVERTRAAGVVAVTLLAGAGTAVGGPVAFVGFMIPHLARKVTGPDQRWVFVMTLLLAPTLLLAADIAGRVLIRPAELPVGIVTAFVGAPILIAVVRRSRLAEL